VGRLWPFRPVKLVRISLILRFFDVRIPALCLTALCLPLFAPGQEPAAPATQPPAPPAPAVTQPAASGKTPAVPDYADKRTLTFGVWGWATIPGTGPDIIGGQAATGFETLDSLGKYHLTPGVEASLPVTRTAEIHFEGFLSKGDGTQNAPANTALFSTGFNTGDFLSTQFQITSLRLSYEDLLYPFKFPVAKFRVRSLWEVQYLAMQGTVDAPLRANTADSSGNLISNSGSGTRTIILPTFGLAAEYAISPHVLLRAAASGFGLPHRAEIYDGEATVSYRMNRIEIRGGYKFVHFKSSPRIDEYVMGTVQGGFVGVRYHWGL